MTTPRLSSTERALASLFAQATQRAILCLGCQLVRRPSWALASNHGKRYCEPTAALNALVAKPGPPFQISKPASIAMR
jgi:hypothetical protein